MCKLPNSAQDITVCIGNVFFKVPVIAA